MAQRFNNCFLTLTSLWHGLWINVDLLVFFAGEPVAGKNAAEIPKGYWSFSWVAEDKLSFPNNPVPPSGESDLVGPPQTDGQAEAFLSSKDP